MPSARLTKSAVDRFETRSSDYIIWDEALPGFGLRIKPSGVRSYVVQYRCRDTGASRRMTLGKHGPLLTLDQARKQARGLLADALRGEDPARRRRERKAAPTMMQLCDDYLERHAVPNKRPRSVASDKSMLNRVVRPALGSKRVEAVTRRDIEDLKAGLAATPYQANRVLALLSKMFSLAMAWDCRADNPVKGVARFAEDARDRWLSDAELLRLWEALDRQANQQAANVVRLQLLTGSRLGEVMSARREEFDLERGVWRKPSHHTKQKRTEHVPLSEAARALVARIIEAHPADEVWMFPGRRPGQPMKDIKRFWAGLLADAGVEDYRRHDNRHTYASHLVSDGLSLEIVGRLMGHTSPTTTRRYAHMADDPLRQATESFSGRLTGERG